MLNNCIYLCFLICSYHVAMRTCILPYLLSFQFVFFVFQPRCSVLLCICFSHISRHVCVPIYICILISIYIGTEKHQNICTIYTNRVSFNQIQSGELTLLLMMLMNLHKLIRFCLYLGDIVSLKPKKLQCNVFLIYVFLSFKKKGLFRI